MPLRFLVSGLFLLSACSNSVSEPEAPTTDQLVAAWSKGQGALKEQLASLPPAEAWLALQTLLQVRPESSTEPLCELVDEGFKEACSLHKAKIQERPHLWGQARRPIPDQPPNQFQERQPRPSTHRRVGSGPQFSFVDPPKDLPFPFSDLEAHKTSCPETDSQCRIGQALRAIRRDKLELTAQICLNESTMWQSECFFRMAEEQSKRTAKDIRKGTLSDSVRFCLASGQFMPECLEQSFILYSVQTPPSDDPRAESWKNAVAHASALQEAELGLPSDFKKALLGRYWGSLLLGAYQLAETVTGDPLDSLPDEATLHIRAAAAYRLVGILKEDSPEWGTGLQDLARWGQNLSEQLTKRSPTPSERKKPPKADIQDFWQEDAVGDEDMPAIMYLGSSRRTWSTDSSVDSQICMLEAMARHKVGTDLIQAATEHPKARIAWTATRLIRAESSRRRHKPDAL